MSNIEKIQFLSCRTPKDKISSAKQLTSIWCDFIEQLIQKVIRELSEQVGFIQLRTMEEGEICYFHCELNFVVGDLSQESILIYNSTAHVEALLESIDEAKGMKVGNQYTGALRETEYAFFCSSDYLAATQRLGWIDLTQRFLATVRPLTFHGHGEKVCYLPVFYFNGKNQPLPLKLMQLIQKGFLPTCMDPCPPEVNQAIKDGTFVKKMRAYAGTAGEFPDPEKPRVVHPNIPNLEELEKIKKYYRDKPRRTAGMKSYDNSIFQPERGSWDLYPFAGLSEEKLKDEDGPWYQVESMYARDPRRDVAPDSCIVAIDFGTKSTTVAIYDGQGGGITIIPIGGEAKEEESFENPTILKFCGIEEFDRAYETKPFQPDTKFDDLMVSHQALSDYEDFSNQQQKNMLQYLSHLKQWADKPDQILMISDSHNRLLETTMNQESDNPNPIEIYAYYIGLYINNMHQGRIYLKYLLSYSASYLQESRELIRAAFERGLKKSLPETVGEDENYMKRFEVRLWKDEATAYAVCALTRYLEQGKANRESDPLLEELQKGDVFYGVYDFGGGTLDFSLGTLHLTSKIEIRKLRDGGAAHLGCENILEELAFQIFNDKDNRENLISRKILCNKPMFYGMCQGQDKIVGNSNAARYNTCNLIHELRQYWLHGSQEWAEKQEREGVQTVVYLQQEDGTSCMSSLGNTKRDQVLNLNFPPEKLEAFFCSKVQEGIELFVDFYRDTIQQHPELKATPFFVFLGGNASKAKRVRKCFTEYLEHLSDPALANLFQINPPLPTEHDQQLSAEQPQKSIPTAKSGVVFGLLMARPGSEIYTITDETPQRQFRYYLGRRQINLSAFTMESFQLLVRPEQLRTDYFRKLMQIPQEQFELLYTDDRRYELGRREIDGSVNTLLIRVPPEAVGLWLYARRMENDSDVLTMVISIEGGEYRDDVNQILGVCSFRDCSFQPVKTESEVEAGNAEKTENAAESEIKTETGTIVVTDGSGYQLGAISWQDLHKQENHLVDLNRPMVDDLNISLDGRTISLSVPGCKSCTKLGLAWNVSQKNPDGYAILICSNNSSGNLVYALDFDKCTWTPIV